MFGRWNNARVKAADKALQEGHLDDAIERLRQCQGGKADRSLEAVIDDAGRALAARARLHAQAGRVRDALDDLNKLETIGRLDPEAGALRDRLRGEMKFRVDEQQIAQDAVARAQQQLRAGQLETVRGSIERVPDARQRDQLNQELSARERRTRERLDQARKALQNDDIELAFRHWSDALQMGRIRETDDFAGDLAAGLQRSLDDAFRTGRLDRWFALLSVVQGLQSHAPGLHAPLALTGQMQAAAGQLASNQFADVRAVLLRLQAAQQRAAWIDDALKSLDVIERARMALLAGPLALVPVQVGIATRVPAGISEVAAQGHPGAATHQPLLLLVDGTGSALLVFGDVTRIGRADGGAAVEVPIPGDLLSHHADIVRAGEDYFLVAHGPATINAAPTTRTLLRDGDRIKLGANIQFVFRKPSQRSESAALLLSSRARLAQDVSQVILFRSTCLIGPQVHCHMQTREGRDRLVMFERGGQLFIRHAAETGQAVNSVAPMPVDRTTDFADLRFTIKRFGAGANPAA